MNRDRLAPWWDAPAASGVLTDFDGTLSPIVEDPQRARPLPGAVETLGELGRRYRTVAVISGRPVAYLIDRLGPPPGVTLVGLYGLEKVERDGVHILPEALRWRQCVGQVAEAARSQLPAGVYIEPKGLTLGLHVRRAPELAATVEAWAEDQARRTGLRVQHGKMALELVPPVSTDKGRVVLELAQDLRAVCFLGDDLGDLPAFAVLGQLAATGRTTLSVAVRTVESPPELLAQADITVEGPEGALAWLRQLAAPPG
jgi:trehalose 6-phosphate phosphatase